MELLHEIVEHKRFGRGKVVSFNGHILEIEFPEYGRRTFSYPSAFDTFLTLLNSSLNDELQSDLDAIHKINAAKQAQKAEAIQKESAAFAEQHSIKKKRTASSKATVRSSKKS